MHRFTLNWAGMGFRGLPFAAGGGGGFAVGAGRSAVVAAALAGGTVAYLRSYPQSIPSKDPADKKLMLERPVMEMICGAIGEVAQVCVLYPLETIKVKCQAEGISAAAALRGLLANGPAAAARQLYAGMGAAAICSVVVGAVHYASFCMSRRAAMAATAGGSSSGSGDGNGGGGEGNASAANAFAAVVGALATALVESPCDLYRHMAQAGLVSGDFLSEMAKAVRRDGVGALYWGFFSFCMESFPYDITELGTYGSLSDWRESALKRDDEVGRRVAAVPSHVWDMGIGAAAGAAAVVVSMPFDVVKTYLQTHGSQMAASAGGGAWGEAVAFGQVARRMVAQHGPGALFVGMAPRLVQQVPSSTICWVVIEQCRALLEPYTKP